MSCTRQCSSEAVQHLQQFWPNGLESNCAATTTTSLRRTRSSPRTATEHVCISTRHTTPYQKAHFHRGFSSCSPTNSFASTWKSSVSGSILNTLTNPESNQTPELCRHSFFPCIHRQDLQMPPGLEKGRQRISGELFMLFSQDKCPPPPPFFLESEHIHTIDGSFIAQHAAAKMKVNMPKDKV